jgi:hypothetical protein
MKLGEALTLRKDINNRLQRLRERLLISAQVQEGEKPPEEPVALLAELDSLLQQWSELVARINRTNLSTSLSDGATLTDALARRDALAWRQKTLREVAERASQQAPRHMRSELRLLAAVDVAELRSDADRVAKERRELDTAIQEANWLTELAD